MFLVFTLLQEVCVLVFTLVRALCRIKLLPVTRFGGHMDVKQVYKLLNVSDDLKWTTNRHVTPFSLAFKA